MVDRISTSEAARILGCSRETALRYAHAGQLGPVERIDGGHGYIRVLRSRVEKLAAQKREQEARP